MAYWKRPNEMHDYVNSTLWGAHGISPMAALPSKTINDAWFLSSAAALAEDPKRI